ncbi:MAG: DsbA family protein [Chlamydiia bacterium]|nr:DsbA family protein [Chlamydiia bacterium]
MKNLPFALLVVILVAGGYIYYDSARENHRGSVDKNFRDSVETVLVENPEILVKAMQTYQEKMRQNQLDQFKNAVNENHDNLKLADSPSFGNPNGDIVLVEFMDYLCGHCRQVAPIVEQLTKENPSLKVVVKLLPIFGPQSTVFAKAGQAAAQQGKFSAFHELLLSKVNPKMTREELIAVAKEAGLNLQAFEKVIDAETDPLLEENKQLAQKLGIRGTPFFIFLSQPYNPQKTEVMAGSGTKESFEEKIKQTK